MSLVLVVIVHLLAIWALTRNYLPRTSQRAAPDLTVALIQSGGAALPRPTPLLEDMPPPDPAPPAIEIADNAGPANTALVDDSAQLIAPRPDPAHQNPLPEISAALSKAAGKAILRVLVEEDGTIADAQVAKSSGMAEIDAMLIAFTKSHWRYLPAELAGKAIQHWTTIIVPFRLANG